MLRKLQKKIVILIFFTLPLWGSEKAFQFDIIEIDKVACVDLRQIENALKNFDVIFSKKTFAVSILYQKSALHTEIDRKYYILNGKQFVSKNAFRYQSGKIYAPIDVLEDIFSDLRIDLNFLRKQDHYAITQKDSTKEKIPAEKKTNALDYIILDAGHGGHDPGAIGYKRLAEKKLTLSLVQYLKKRLEEELKIKVLLTRNDDRFLSLERRTLLANRLVKKGQNAVFISIHGNSTLSKKTHGYEVYYLSQNPSNEEARRTALRENSFAGDQPYIKILQSYLISAVVQAESKTLANALDESLMTSLRGLVSSRGVKRADFAVLRGALMPAVLFEIGYLTNAKESQVLTGQAFREKLGDGMVKALKNYIKRAYPR